MSMDHTASVAVRSPILARNMDIFIADKGTPVLSIKFSPDLLVLAVQRSNKSVEFLNVQDSTGVDLIEYSQTCSRARSAKILGFCWVSSTEIVFVTDTHGLESYQIRPEKKILKSLKNYSLAVNWFLYTPPYLLLSSGSACNVFHIFVLRGGGNYQRYPKFEVEVSAPPISQGQPAKLMERDVVLAPVYGALYVLIVKQVSKLNAGAEVVMYQLNREGVVKITDVLLLECNGRFAINILDNLVVVHHQQSRMSKIFDLRLNNRMDGIRYHYPISSYSIEPYQIKLSGYSVPYELYSSNWAVFLPSIIVDAKLGCLWQLELQIDGLASLIHDKLKRAEFLLFRETDAKVVLLRHLTDYLHDYNDYSTVIKVFDLLNAKLKSIVTKVVSEESKKTVYLDQSECFRYLLLPFSNSKQLDPCIIVSVLVEYLKSLIAHQLEPQYYIHELIVNALVQFRMYPLLRLLVENGVFYDSKPFACLLLSLDNVFPPSFQMALDMLKRVGNSSEERAEVLLAKYQIFPAIRDPNGNGNGTGNGYTDHRPLYLELPQHHALMIITALLLVLSAVVGTLGNILSLRNTGNIFILNLAIADTVVTAIVDPFNAVGAVAGRRILWEDYTLCQVVASLCAPACIGSLWNMCTISVSRYFLICKPHLYPRIFTLSNCILMCLVTWIISHLIHLPNHIGWGMNHFSENYYLCTFDVDSHHFAIFYVFLAMVVPLGGVLFGYTLIFLKVRNVRTTIRRHKEKILVAMTTTIPIVDQPAIAHDQAKVPPNGSGPRRSTIRPTTSVVKRDDVTLAKTMFLAFAIFFVSWTPFALLVIANNPKAVPGWVYIVAIVLGHGNSAVNPILYGVSNKKFRDGYRHLLGNRTIGVRGRGGTSFVTKRASVLVCHSSDER
ncbi:Uncharacterized protein C18orf8 [Hypsibius exemplaris]|uniref:Uncharacterized protein C18orf8 n=1 Tax=Hypsibius exemplaris TaxID=2072580 RepID=A0A1W0XDD5_HYPEX|nr:Uncharacterized protein C18orf8 [Hypsibius exemplaris]